MELYELPPQLSNRIKEDDDGCWMWTGPIDMNGYAKVYISGAYRPQKLVHRLVIDLCEGLIEGLQVDHLCFQRACVNPDHLEQVTSQENMRRMWARRKNLKSESEQLLEGLTERIDGLIRESLENTD